MQNLNNPMTFLTTWTLILILYKHLRNIATKYKILELEITHAGWLEYLRLKYVGYEKIPNVSITNNITKF